MGDDTRTEKSMSATLPFRATPEPAVVCSSSEHDAAASKPSSTSSWSEEQHDTDQQGHPVHEEPTLEQMTAKLETLQKRIHELETSPPSCLHYDATGNETREKAEDSSIAKTQPGSDIEEKEQKDQSHLHEPESQQPPQNGGCPECRIKVAHINYLESELKDQEERARQHEEAACMHEWNLANAHVDEVRKELSTRINELEAQKSGQISISEDPGAQPRPTHYYCDNCDYLQMELREARQKSRDLDDKCTLRGHQMRGLEHGVEMAYEVVRMVKEDLDVANREIARLRAEPGRRTSKL